jgi:uncharacterized membrane protein HdeD (DUF308 family)
MNTIATRTSSTGWSIALGIALILFGIFFIIVPIFGGIAVSLFFGWLILLGSMAHFTYAWFQRRVGSVLWQVLIAFVYFIAAFWIFWHPIGGVAALTLILAIYIGAEGILELATFFAMHALPGTRWFLVDGIISLILAGLILIGWPSSSLWAIGTLVGISFLMSGIARLSMPMSQRRLLVEA